MHWEIYGTKYNCPDKRFLEVPQFFPSVINPKTLFGNSFAFDAPTVWNDLPDEGYSALICKISPASLWYGPENGYGVIIF